MNGPRFQPGQNAVVTLDGTEKPCRVFGYEKAENLRGFHGDGYVYHVVPEGGDFSVIVRETDLHPAAAS